MKKHVQTCIKGDTYWKIGLIYWNGNRYIVTVFLFSVVVVDVSLYLIELPN